MGSRDDAEEDDTAERAGLTRLAASAVSGATPPAGPEWRRGALPLVPRAMVFERPLCVALDGFTLHAATRAGGGDEPGREALLKYILRPAVAQERVTRGPEGLLRIGLKKPFSDGTVAIDLDPLSLLSRLAASVPPPRFHTVRYAGVLGTLDHVPVIVRAERRGRSADVSACLPKNGKTLRFVDGCHECFPARVAQGLRRRTGHARRLQHEQ